MVRKITPARTTETPLTTAKSSASDIAAFVKAAGQANEESSGRLIFAMDATMSRQPTWDRACQIQGSMFEAAGKKAGLSVQLVYFRGYGECRASKWVANGAAMANLMTTIDCRGGHTQIGKVLTHTNKETVKKKVAALVFIGDAMEEDIDQLCDLAGKLGAQGVKAFMFQEGYDDTAERAFREVARLTKGAYMRLDNNSAKALEDLLSAVAVYATGGRKALIGRGDKTSKLLIEQMKP